MKKLFIVANWKSHKTSSDAKKWLDQVFTGLELQTVKSEKEVIVAAPFTLLSSLHEYITDHHLSCKLAAQDVSPFAEGAYTGAVTAEEVKEYADYVLIGHSERKRLFGETEEMVTQKVEQSLAVGLTPIVFLQDTEANAPTGTKIVVYEPPSAISTVSHGVPVTPKDVAKACDLILAAHPEVTVLYGGSVDDANVASFTNLSQIHGVVPGKASLDAATFAQLVTNA